MIQRITRRMGFNEKLKRYVDIKTKRIISNKEGERRIKISNRLKGRLRKIYRNTIGSVMYISGVKHDLKVVILTRKKVKEDWAKRKLTRELLEWWREEFQEIASPPYNYEVISGRKVHGKPTSNYRTREIEPDLNNTAFELNELIDKGELPKDFRWEKDKELYVIRLFDDKREIGGIRGLEKNKVSLDAWLD
jgi:hypothetical protein